MHSSTGALKTTILATALGLDTGVGNCDELTNDADARSAAEEWAFPQMCEGSRGKAHSDEWRCTSGTVEIKCK